MEMRVEWLRAFRAIMQTGTITGATTIVHRTQPQISRMISGLEVSLGFQLFAREGRRLIPTADGLRFYSQVEPLLLSLDRLTGFAEDIKEKRGRPLVVAAEPFMLHSLVPDAVQQMHRRFNTKFAIDLCVREVGLWTSRNSIDIAVVALPFTQTDMEQVPFATAELVATLPPGHPLIARETIDIADLAREPFIALRSTTLLRSQIDSAAVASGVPFKPVIEVSSGATACELVASGIGVSISDPIVANAYSARGVVSRKLTAPLNLTYGLLINPSMAGEQLAILIQCLSESAKALGAGHVSVSDNLENSLRPYFDG